MINSNAITKELAHILSSIGTSFTFKNDSVTTHSFEGQSIDFTHWKKGDLCLVRGLVIDNDVEGLCVELSAYDKDYKAEIGELHQIPLSDFDRVLMQVSNGFTLKNQAQKIVLL